MQQESFPPEKKREKVLMGRVNIPWWIYLSHLIIYFLQINDSQMHQLQMGLFEVT